MSASPASLRPRRINFVEKNRGAASLQRRRQQRTKVQIPNVMVPAKLPEKLSNAIPKPASMPALRPSPIKGSKEVRGAIAQALYSSTRDTEFGGPKRRKMKIDAGKVHSLSDLYKEPAKYDKVTGKEIRDRSGEGLMKISAFGSGLQGSFAYASRFDVKIGDTFSPSMDRMYDIDCGPKAGIAKTAQASLRGSANARDRTTRSMGPSLRDILNNRSPGPGAYDVTKMQSSKLDDHWNRPSVSFQTYPRTLQSSESSVEKHKTHQSMKGER